MLLQSGMCVVTLSSHRSRTSSNIVYYDFHAYNFSQLQFLCGERKTRLWFFTSEIGTWRKKDSSITWIFPGKRDEPEMLDVFNLSTFYATVVSQNFWFVENPGKILKNLGISVSTPLFSMSDKWDWLSLKTSKFDFIPRKKWESLFYLRSHKNIISCERKRCIAAHRFFGQVWKHSGKIPSYPQKFALPTSFFTPKRMRMNACN